MLTAMNLATPATSRPHQSRVDRSHGKDEGRNHAGHCDRDDSKRGITIELAQPYRARQPVLGHLSRGYEDRHQRERYEHRDEHEGSCGRGTRRDEQELPAAESDVQNHHVDREQPAAVLAAGAIVQPAFGDHIDSGETQSRHAAHHAPDERVDERPLNEDRGRRDGRERREHPDVPEATHQRRRDASSEQIPDVIARHDRARDDRRKSLERGAHAQQGALQSHAEHEHAHSEEQRPGRGERAGRPGNAAGSRRGRRRLSDDNLSSLDRSGRGSADSTLEGTLHQPPSCRKLRIHPAFSAHEENVQ